MATDIARNATRGALAAQLRALLALTNTEIQVAETRTVQARTEAVRTELSENAANGRERARAIQSAIRELGSFPDIVAPAVGRVTALVKTIAEQAQPLDEALLGDLVLEHQLLDRSRYTKALATVAKDDSVVALADRLIEAHTATVEWLTIVLAEDALGGPTALRRTPLQAATGAAVRLINTPATITARGVDRAIGTAKEVPSKVNDLIGRGARAGDVAVDTLAASRDAALETAEEVTRDRGATTVAEAIHRTRAASGTLEESELPVAEYDSLNVTNAVAAIKELSDPADLRAVMAYEERNKNRHSVVSAVQTRLADVAKDVVGLG